ncbi:MAG: hypothetical protein J1G04_04085 [Clostridiales bacterium]|nr:hypothetical protein [Clostridiales bacterium]
MAKDIERIIEELVVPEMEYVKSRTLKSISIEEEVPEVVLPKTKAEVYKEAKGRLKQKTAAVSKAYEKNKAKNKGKKSAPKVKTVELETAAAAVAGTRSIEEREHTARIKSRLNTVKKIVDEPKWVGGSDELVPFAWRMPLVEIERPTKVYRAVVKASKESTTFLTPQRETKA